MPRRDPAAQRAYMREWYARSPEPRRKAIARRNRYRARNKEFLHRRLEEVRACGGCGSSDPQHCSRWEHALYALANRPVSLARLERALGECLDRAPPDDAQNQ